MPRGWSRNECGILQRRSVDAVDLPQRGEIEQPRHLDDVAGMHVEFTQQQLQHVLGHVVGHLEAHRRSEPSTGQLPLERLQQILVAIFVDLEIGVAGYAECVVLNDFHARKQRRQEGRDQLFRRQEADFFLPADSSAPSRSSSSTKRSTLSGTLTRAKCWPPSSGCLTVTARLRLRPLTNGNGCAGSTASGVRTGKTCSVK